MCEVRADGWVRCPGLASVAGWVAEPPVWVRRLKTRSNAHDPTAVARPLRGGQIGLGARSTGSSTVLCRVFAVVGFDGSDLVVLWDTGLRTPIAPWNSTPEPSGPSL